MVMLSKQKQIAELAKKENIKIDQDTSVMQMLYYYRILAEQIFKTAYRLDHDLNIFRKQSDKFCYTPFKELNRLQIYRMMENDGYKSGDMTKYLRCVTMERVQQLYRDVSGLNVAYDVTELKQAYKLKMSSKQNN